MKKILIIGLLTTVCAVIVGCDDGGGHNIPSKTGGGGRSQTYVPAGNRNGGQYMHVPK